MQESLRSLSARRLAVRQRVARIRFLDTFRNLFEYLVFRNRFPIIHNLATRSFTLLEIYFLYYYFYKDHLGAVIIVVFYLTFSRQLFQSVAQYFRRELVEAELFGDRNRWSHIYWLFSSSSIGFALFCGVSLVLLLLFTTNDLFELSLGLVWILLFPLELLSITAWSVAYTKQRIYREFWIVILFRALPSIFLFFLGPILGPFSYIIGILIGRALEGYYLLHCARHRLKRQGFSPVKPRRWKSELYSHLVNRELFERVLFLLAPQLYGGVLIFLLEARDLNHLLLYFLVYQFTTLCSYPVFRIAHSLGMDVFLALKAGNRIWAEAIIRKALRGVSVATVCVGAAFLLVFFFSRSLAYAYFGQGVLYFMYALPLFAVVSLFRAGASLHLWMTTERSLSIWLLGVFLGLGLPIQFALYMVYRGNIGTVLLVEIFVYFIASLPLLLTLLRVESPIERGSIDSKQTDYRIESRSHFEAIVRHRELCSLPYSLLLFSLRRNQQDQASREVLLQRMVELMPDESVGVVVTKRAYLYFLPTVSSDEANTLKRNIVLQLGGQLSELEFIDQKSDSLNELKRLIEKFGTSWHSSDELRSLSAYLREEGEEKALWKLLSEIQQEEIALEVAVGETLRSLGVASLPYIQCVNGIPRIQGELSSEFVHYAYWFFNKAVQQELIPRRASRFRVFIESVESWMIVDSSQLEPEQKEKLLYASYRISLAYSTRHFLNLKNQHATKVPARISSFQNRLHQPVGGEV